MTNDDFLGVGDVAEMLDVSPATVTAAARTGELPGRKIGREWRFERTAVRAWFQGSDAATPLAARIAPAVAGAVITIVAKVMSDLGQRLAVEAKYKNEAE